MPIFCQPAAISTPASTNRETVVTQGSAEIARRVPTLVGFSEVTSIIVSYSRPPPALVAETPAISRRSHHGPGKRRISLRRTAAGHPAPDAAERGDLGILSEADPSAAAVAVAGALRRDGAGASTGMRSSFLS
ncbi:hypothetical protein ACWDWV_22430, partial [Streptosporangium sandarakinum]